MRSAAVRASPRTMLTTTHPQTPPTPRMMPPPRTAPLPAPRRGRRRATTMTTAATTTTTTHDDDDGFARVRRRNPVVRRRVGCVGGVVPDNLATRRARERDREELQHRMISAGTSGVERRTPAPARSPPHRALEAHQRRQGGERDAASTLPSKEECRLIQGEKLRDLRLHIRRGMQIPASVTSRASPSIFCTARRAARQRGDGAAGDGRGGGRGLRAVAMDRAPRRRSRGGGSRARGRAAAARRRRCGRRSGCGQRAAGHLPTHGAAYESRELPSKPAPKPAAPPKGASTRRATAVPLEGSAAKRACASARSRSRIRCSASTSSSGMRASS